MKDVRPNDQKAMELLLQRGIFARDASIRDLVAISSELSSLGEVEKDGDWTFISPHYVYKGGALGEIGEEVIHG